MYAYTRCGESKDSIYTHKYFPETKRSAVLDYLNGMGSLDDICTKYDISARKILQRWIKRYNGHEEFKQPNSGSAIYMTKGGNTTLNERMEIVSHCISNNKDYGKTIKRYGVSYPQIYGWVRKYEKEGTDVLVDRGGKRKDKALMNLDIVKPVFGFFDGFAHYQLSGYMGKTIFVIFQDSLAIRSLKCGEIYMVTL